MTNWLSSNPFRMSDKITVDKLADMFGLPSFDEVEEMNLGYIDEAASGIEDEDEQMEAMQSAQGELYRNWRDAVVFTASELFGKHSLDLEPTETQKGYKLQIKPETSWKDAAGEIMTTINGVGMFYFSSLKEFLDSGPYTPRQAVLSHIAYIAYYPEVYGPGDAKRIYERAWR